jgi:hypothetical protein
MAKPRAKRGDVFSIPIDDRRVGYGQVVLKNHSSFPIYIVVFGTAYDRNQEVSLNEIVADGIALVGASMDARIYHGMWKIIGNIEPDRSRIPRPNFKVYIGGSDFVENFDGNRLREATPEDVRHYDNRWSRAPMGFESAIKAIHGVGIWESNFDKLTFKHALDQATDAPDKTLHPTAGNAPV